LKKYLVLCIGLLLLAAIAYFQFVRTDSLAVLKPIVTTSTVEQALPVDPKREAYLQSHVHIDAARVAERDGVFYLDESIRFYFEYYMMRRAELSDTVLVAAVYDDARARYGAKSAAYIKDLFARYLRYRDAADIPLSDTDSAIDSYNAQEASLVNLRERLFNAIENKALFDDGYLKQYSYEKSSQKRVDEYYQRAKNLPAESLDALRTEMFGMEAAVRFKELELQRQRWQQKLTDYYCQRVQIDNAKGLVAVDKLQQVQQLQAQYFDKLQVKRVQALERNDSLGMKAEDCP
jgi:lipase chaperone LimK